MPYTRAFKAGLLGSGTFMIKLSQLICAAALSRIFCKESYADYRQTFLVFNAVGPFLALGLPMALFYFLPHEPQKGKSLLTGNLLLLALMGLLFAMFIWFGGADFIAERFHNHNLAYLLLIFSPIALLTLPARSINACLVSSDHVTALTVYNILSKIFYTVVVIGMAYIWSSPKAAISGAVISTFIVLIPAVVLMYKATLPGTWIPEKNDIYQQLKYSLPFGFALMADAFAVNLDKILVSDMTNPIESAIYINGAMELPLIEVITGSAMAILIPEFTRLFKDGDTEKISYLWNKAAVKCSLIILPLMVLCFIMGSEIIKIIYSAQYAQSVHPFRIYLLILPLRVVNFGAIFMATGKNKLILYRAWTELFLNLIISVILIMEFGPLGAAAGTVLVNYTFSIFYNLYFASKVLKLSQKALIPFVELIKVLGLSLIAAVVFIPVLWFKTWPDIIKLCIFTPVYSLAVIILFDLFGYVKIKDIINSVQQKILSR